MLAHLGSHSEDGGEPVFESRQMDDKAHTFNHYAKLNIKNMSFFILKEQELIFIGPLIPTSLFTGMASFNPHRNLLEVRNHVF